MILVVGVAVAVVVAKVLLLDPMMVGPVVEVGSI